MILYHGNTTIMGMLHTWNFSFRVPSAYLPRKSSDKNIKHKFANAYIIIFMTTMPNLSLYVNMIIIIFAMKTKPAVAWGYILITV